MFRFVRISLPLCMLCALGVQASPARGADPVIEKAEHAYATNAVDQTKIHYVSVGKGPLVVFVHGFPDFWESWTHQMRTLASDYRCVAMDLRGYNRSDKPQPQERYAMPLLVADVQAVIRACGKRRATLVGHDWGGAICWATALQHPDWVENLVICNLPHPRGLKRELLINDKHRANTQYARDFQKPGAEKLLSPKSLTAMLQALTYTPWSEEKAAAYQKAFARSDFKAMLAYYRQNYKAELQPKPPLPYKDPTPVIKAKMPVLMFHGLRDLALHHHALNNTWEWVERDLTIVTLPKAGHWVHHDEAERVSGTLLDWLRRRTKNK